ncbi:hypothetical protein MYX77_00930 [Acidobacteriia bacterium AH_259_A11_L15]|nr:hypothetical protein [Acidobacteriia bacterium AH_259_A11_L15]
MTVLSSLGDEVQGERIVCFYRKRDREVLILLTKAHRGWRVKLHGLPARAIVEKELEFVR